MTTILNKISNEMRVFTDKASELDTATVVLGVKTGSRNETAENNGISHFLEHMAFKGTQKRNYLQIAEAIDNVGGYMNAYTSKENTVYYIKLMKDDIELAVDVLSDIFQNSTFPEEEIEKEKGVILQELSATLDTPDDVVFNYFHETAFAGNALERTILGPEENIKKFTKSDFNSYISSRYSAKNSVLSICGNINPEETQNLAQKYLSGLENHEVLQDTPASYTGGNFLKHKEDLEQIQCLIGFKSIDYTNDNYYTMAVLNSILGGGMSSRLFQEIREKRGLVYTISCWNDAYKDTGIFTIYAGTSPEKTDELLIAVKDEVLKICENITDDEMKRVVKQSQSGVAMTKESTSSRAKKGCNDLLMHGKYIPYEEILRNIAEVTKANVLKMASKIFTKSTPTLVLYGNLSGVKSEYSNFIKHFEN